MQTAARSSLALIEFSSLAKLAGLSATKYEALYQQIGYRLRQATTGRAVAELAQELSEFAHHADNMRWHDPALHASRMLSALPEPFNHIGEYYQAKRLQREGKKAEAISLLTHVANRAPLRFRARAVQHLGMIVHSSGKYAEAARYYLEAIRMAASDNWCDLHTVMTATQNLAVIKSSAGDHQAALADLDGLFPMVRAVAGGYKYYHYLNSLAVELGEVGRVEEAQRVCKAVLASPYAPAYPEWRETSDEINLKAYKSRSTVSLSRPVALHNLIYWPERVSLAQSAPNPFRQPGTVTELKDWKRKMVEKQDGKGTDPIAEDMTGQDMTMKLLELITENRYEEDKIRKVLEHALAVFSKRAEGE